MTESEGVRERKKGSIRMSGVILSLYLDPLVKSCFVAPQIMRLGSSNASTVV